MTATAEEGQARGIAPPWIPTDRTFGARLALVRQHMGWGNIAEAATACGIPANSWRNWERDNRAPMRVAEMSALIAARTGCDRYWLVTGEHRDDVSEINRITIRLPGMAERFGWLSHMSGKPLRVYPNGRPRPCEHGPGMVRPARLPRATAGNSI